MVERLMWRVRDVRLELGSRSLVVGILNVTPDSFSDGGRHFSAESAIAKAESMLKQGAALIDIGGESTRPGFKPVSIVEETRRVVPVVEGILSREASCILSIDTSKTEVAKAALQAGAKVINDVCGFQSNHDLASLSADFGAGVILMRNGRDGERNGSILDRIRASWARSISIAEGAGVARESIVLDPGIGFGTTRQEDLEILRGLEELRAFGFPVMLGASRKRITAQPSGLNLSERLEPTLATTVAGISAGVDLFRVHDVEENVRAIGMADLIYRGGSLNE